jgi:hypothetical protein
VKQPLLILLFVSAVFCVDGGFDTKGSFFSDLSLLYYRNRTDPDSLAFGGMSTLRLDIRNRNRSFAKFDGAIDLKMLYGTGANTAAGASDSSAKLPGMPDFMLMSLDNKVLLLDIRRLYGVLYFKTFELSAGRQNISFGKGTVFSPIDQFSSVDFSDFAFRKRGSDVVNITFRLADLWGLSGIAELLYGSREHASAVKLFGTVGSFDLALAGIYRHLSKTLIPGFSFKGDAVLGIYGEGLVLIPAKAGTLAFDGMLGLDYSVGKRWFFVLEYQYLGESSKHSVYSAVNLSINELLSFGVSAIHSFSRNNTLATVQCTWNVLQNADLTAVIQGCHNNPLGQNIPTPDLDCTLRMTVRF